MTTGQGSPILEQGRRLSESILWRFLARAYSRAEPVLWSATNNPCLAEAYACFVLAWLRDWQARQSQAQRLPPDEPVYIVELGAGAGRFSYLFLMRLRELLQATPELADQRVCLVMADNVNEYLQFWTSHPRLAPLLDDGWLDFASFQANRDETIELLHSGRTLSAQTLVNPLVAIANYFFDQIPQDVFRVHNGRLEEGLLTVRSAQGFDEAAILADPAKVHTLQCEYEFRPLDSQQTVYPGEPDIEELLAVYLTGLATSAPFVLPTDSLRSIGNLLKLSGQRLLLMTADKGPLTWEELPHWKCHQPIFDKRHLFAFNLNLHAILEYIGRSGGKSLAPPQSVLPFLISLAAWGAGDEPFTHVADAYQSQIGYRGRGGDRVQVGDHGPAAYIRTVGALLAKESQCQLSLAAYLSFLQLSRHDPEMLNVWDEHLQQQLPPASDVEKRELAQGLDTIWENIFVASAADEQTLIRLAQLNFVLNRHRQAAECLQHSQDRIGESAAVCFYHGLCHLALQEPQAARVQFENALRIDPQHAEARRNLDLLRGST